MAIGKRRSERGLEKSDMVELHQLEVQVAKLTADVEHIKTDVADIKIDLRRLTGDVVAGDKRLDEKIDAVEQRLTARFDALRDEFAAAKIWALGLYFGLAASMLFVMAKGFKWI
jgi:predicted nuclease with TOPRIM domain